MKSFESIKQDMKDRATMARTEGRIRAQRASLSWDCKIGSVKNKIGLHR